MIIRSYLEILWERTRSSYWFLPGLMSAGALVVLYVAVQLDARWAGGGWMDSVFLLDIRNQNAASDLLTTIIGSTINVVGVVFSLTLVALTIVASQYGSQVLSSFMDDSATRFTLGTFIATFIYCLLCLRLVASLAEDTEVPRLPISLAVLFSMFSVGVLIYFLHHIARRIQVANIVKRLSVELLAAAEDLYPEQEPEGGGAALPDMSHGVALRAAAGGYVQAVSVSDLVAYASKRDCLVEVRKRPGDFVVHGEVLGFLHDERHLDEAECRALCEAFVVGSQRTPHQDIQYSIEKLAEVGVRAMSPGINEPYVATKCIDYLSLFLAFLAVRPQPAPIHRDKDGKARVMLHALSFREALEVAFNQLFHFCGSNVDIIQRILEALRRIEARGPRAEHLTALREYRDRLASIIGEREWEGGARDGLLRLCRTDEGDPRVAPTGI